MLVPDHSCIPRLSLPKGAARADGGAAVGKVPAGQTCTPSVCLDFLHMAVRVEGSPLERGAPPASTTSPDTVSRFGTEATFPQGGTGLGLGGQSQVGSPSRRLLAGGSALGLACSPRSPLWPRPPAYPGGGGAVNAAGGRLSAGTRPGNSHWEQGRGRARGHLQSPCEPQDPLRPARAAGAPVPAPGAWGPRTHRHSLPSVLLSSALCRCGY